MSSTLSKNCIKETEWPDSCPLSDEDYFISIGCGNSSVRWALHHKISKYNTESNLQPFLMWKTPHITVEDLDGDKPDVLARLLPRKVQKYIFGNSDVFTSELAKNVSKDRGHDITYYIISSNDEQAEYLSNLIASVPSRVFRMKGTDFFSKSKGFYESMGIDRCACLKGSATIYGTPSLVIDGGTCITYTALDSAGRIMGGGIVPGVEMRLNALKEGTDALPCIKYEEILTKHIQKAINEQRPLPIFSRNTKQAMVVATLGEIAANMRNVIKLWLEKVGPGDKALGDESNPDRKIVVTGGSGDVITKMLQPDCGGIIESSNDANEKFVVSWENTMLHIGVAASLLYHMKRNDYAKKINDGEDLLQKSDPDMDYVGKRVAKYFKIPQKGNDHIYRGTIESVRKSPQGSFYKIVYDDSDAEEVNSEEVDELIEFYEYKGEKKDKQKVLVRPEQEEPQKKRHKKDTNSSHINVKVAKRFEDGNIYSGKITKYDGEFWQVRYEDGDEEEFDAEDLELGVQLYKELNFGR